MCSFSPSLGDTRAWEHGSVTPGPPRAGGLFMVPAPHGKGKETQRDRSWSTDCGVGGQHGWRPVPCLEVLGPEKDPMRKRQRDTGEESSGAGLFSLDPTAPPTQAGRNPPLCQTGLEFIVVAIHRQFRGRLWAGSRCHQLHEVLAATGLHGAGHNCLLPTQQAHLGRVGGQVGVQVGSAKPGSPDTALHPISHPPFTHSGGAVGALPAARALLILHGTELVVLRTGP